MRSRPFETYPFQNLPFEDPHARDARDAAFQEWFNAVHGAPFPAVELDESLEPLADQTAKLADVVLANLTAPPDRAAEYVLVNLYIDGEPATLTIFFDWPARPREVKAEQLPALPAAAKIRRALQASA